MYFPNPEFYFHVFEMFDRLTFLTKVSGGPGGETLCTPVAFVIVSNQVSVGLVVIS